MMASYIQLEKKPYATSWQPGGLIRADSVAELELSSSLPEEFGIGVSAKMLHASIIVGDCVFWQAGEYRCYYDDGKFKMTNGDVVAEVDADWVAEDYVRIYAGRLDGKLFVQASVGDDMTDFAEVVGNAIDGVGNIVVNGSINAVLADLLYQHINIDPIGYLEGNSIHLVLRTESDVSIYPEVLIKKLGSDGDVEIINLTTGQEFCFADMERNETVYVDNDREIIHSNFIFENPGGRFNNQFLYLVPGENILSVSQGCNIKFKYRGKYLPHTLGVEDGYGDNGQEYEPGDGTEEYPFLVATPEDLRKVGSGEDGWNLDCYYLQIANIDLSEYENWEPIAMLDFEEVEETEEMPEMFSGSYNGNEYVISNLSISKSLPEEDEYDDMETMYQGLFGFVSIGASLSNIILRDVNIFGGDVVGCLAGMCGGHITNCHATGTVEGCMGVGGLVGGVVGNIFDEYEYEDDGEDEYGYIPPSPVENSSFNGYVKGEYGVGGLVGISMGATIVSSHANVTIEGTVDDDNYLNGNYIGGLIGADELGSFITDSYTTGSVSNGRDKVGGLVGFGRGIIINNSYSNALVSGMVNVGGLVGECAVESSVENCFATGSVSGEYGYAGGLIGTCNGHDDNRIKIIDCYATGNVDGLGVLGGLVGFIKYGDISSCYATGDISGLEFIGGLVGVVLMDGNIESCRSNGFVNGTSESYYTGGLVGAFDAEDGFIDDCYAEGDVVGGEYTGGLVGACDEGNITNCHAIGTVDGTIGVGGLIGMSLLSFTYTNFIDKCYATGDVKGYFSIGGLIGANELSVNQSYATGSVEQLYKDNGNEPGHELDESMVGGLIGANAGDVANSYASGSVSGNFITGGLIGYCPLGSVEHCYAVGNVQGDEHAGGLIGLDEFFDPEDYQYEDPSVVINSYWDKNTTNQNTSAGSDDSYGKTTIEMKQKDTYTDWDIIDKGNFDPDDYNIWFIDEDEDYPRLWYEWMVM